MLILLSVSGSRGRSRLRMGVRNWCLVVGSSRVGGIIIIVRRRGVGGLSGI